MTPRAEFSRKTKLLAADRAGFPDDFRCECCGLPITPSDPAEFDHRVACEHGGDNSLENCVVLRRSCHKPKTRADMAKTVKGRKVRAAHAGAKTPKRKMPYRRFDGSPVYPGRE